VSKRWRGSILVHFPATTQKRLSSIAAETAKCPPPEPLGSRHVVPL
jgi:hypothetical protein